MKQYRMDRHRLLRWMAIPGIVFCSLATIQYWSPQLGLPVLGGMLALAVLLLMRAINRQADRLEAGQRQAAENVLRQMDALFALHGALRGHFPLPPSRGWAASPDILRLAALEIATNRPRVIAELGSGISTLIHAALLRQHCPDGKLISIEHDPVYAAVVQDRLDRAGLAAHVDIIICPLTEQTIRGERKLWYGIPSERLDAIEGVGMLFVDGPPGNTCPLARYPALPVFAPKLASQALILVDDAARSDEHAIVERWREEFAGITEIPADAEKGVKLLRWP